MMREQEISVNKKLAIISDDLTGASDTGAQFALAGLSTRVLFGTWNEDDAQGADILVINTDSRQMDAEDAAAAVRSAAASLRSTAVPFYKKIDSTLRGQVGAELDALMEELNSTCAVLCPAFPANGRTMAGGTLLVNGQPATIGAAGKDLLTPVSESHVPTLLKAQSCHPVLTCSLDELNAGKFQLKLKQARKIGAIVVCDASTEADLLSIAKQSLAELEGMLLVGSAGLSKTLAKILAASKKNPVIVVVGSVNPVSREQVQWLVDSGAAQVTLSPVDVFGADSSQRFETLAETCAAIARHGQVPVLVSADRKQQNQEISGSSGLDSFASWGASSGLDIASTAKVVAQSLAKVVGSFFGKIPEASVVASGGDIALAILAEWGCTSLEITGEAAPGLPRCVTRSGRYPGVQLVTKAGGFGKPDALEKAAQILAEKSSYVIPRR
jgi:uncharacterized protein YgbK (DUF1537 family)